MLILLNLKSSHDLYRKIKILTKHATFLKHKNSKIQNAPTPLTILNAPATVINRPPQFSAQRNQKKNSLLSLLPCIRQLHELE
jgi:hypothetical protein